jgi:hypothetical protein
MSNSEVVWIFEFELVKKIAFIKLVESEDIKFTKSEDKKYITGFSIKIKHRVQETAELKSKRKASILVKLLTVMSGSQ